MGRLAYATRRHNSPDSAKTAGAHAGAACVFSVSELLEGARFNENNQPRQVRGFAVLRLTDGKRKGTTMEAPTFAETSAAAIGFNRLKQHGERTHIMSMFRDGRRVNDWHATTFAEEAVEQHHLATAWRILGLKPQEKVAIFGKNRPRWIHTMHSLLIGNIVVVPVYPSLTAADAAYVLRDSGARYAVVDTFDQAQKVMSQIHDLPQLRKIFVMDAIPDLVNERIGSYDSLVAAAAGRVDMQALYDGVREIKGDDLAAIIYTSGTTGKPKGVMLSNGNFLSQRVMLSIFNIDHTDVFLNHLPFCHSFGMTADLLATSEVGATMAIADGIGAEQIRHALGTIRPTILMSVPRLFEKLYVEVRRLVGQRPARVQKIFQNALDVGKQVFDRKNEHRWLPPLLLAKYQLAKVVLMKVRRQAGMDRVRVAYAGGGPTSPELCYFFQSLGIDIFQGYGLTETSPVANVNVPGKNKMGTVGPAIPGVEEKIAPDGEILLRGDNLMKGYHNEPAATAEAIDPEGWFHTGDIGRLDEDGYLTITDRKKELIVTAGGKNIAPLALESAFNTERFIERIVVIGDRRKYLTALVCPNFEAVRDWAKAKGLSLESGTEMAASPEVRQLMEERVAAVNKDFARFEQIKKFTVMDHEFSEATGEITPTLKVKRRVVDEKYRAVIDGMYPKDDE